MKCGLKTKNYRIEYVESKVNHPILWESHCHAQYEMIAVIEGNITVMLEGKAYHLKEDQVIIIPPLFYHSITANKEGIYRRITALFNIDAIPSVLQYEFTQDVRDAYVDSNVIKKLKDICQKDEYAFYIPLLEGLMTEMFYDVIQTSQYRINYETDEFLQKAFHYIDKHLHEKILLDDLAKYTSRSKSSFCHLFRTKMNISPKQYILQKKLALASKLIDEGVPHTMAALQVGYDNYSNFYRLMKNNFDNSN